MGQYSGTGAHLTRAELRVWTSLLDVSRILDTEVERQLIRDHDMTHREYEVLVRLDGAGGRERMSQLARKIETSAPLITQTVAKLEKRAWVVRQSIESDGRGVDAVLTAAGRTALKIAAKPHAALIRALLLEPLGDDLAEVGDALGAVADHLREHRVGTPCAAEDCPLSRSEHL